MVICFMLTLIFLLWCFCYLLQAASDDEGLNEDEESASEEEKNEDVNKEKTEVFKLLSFSLLPAFCFKLACDHRERLFILLQKEYFSISHLH